MEKIDTYKGMMVKVLLNSGITRIFMDKRTAAKHGFKLQKLERPIAVKNMNRTNNSRGAIMHQVECNVYYKGHRKDENKCVQSRKDRSNSGNAIADST